MFQIILIIILIISLSYVLLRQHHSRLLQQRVTQTQPAITAWLGRLEFSHQSTDTLPGFTSHLATISDFLPDKTLATLREAAIAQTNIDQTLIPGHKKGNTVAYNQLREHAPEIVAFYLSPELRETLRKLIGTPVQPTPAHDQSSCSLLIYTDPGDHIGWHYDYNFYHGRHFTILLSLENRQLNEEHKLSSAVLQVKNHKEVKDIPTPANSLVVFEGKQVLHRATKLAKNERRILLSMTFCTDDSTSLALDLFRRIKDTAFFGLRALWS
ncbi:MAG: 2OG-Fe(II) oxygenase [Thiotrichales bacterium]